MDWPLRKRSKLRGMNPKRFSDALKLDPENFFALKNENVDIGADLSTEYNAAVRLFSNQVDDL